MNNGPTDQRIRASDRYVTRVVLLGIAILALVALLVPDAPSTEELVQELQRTAWVNILPTGDFDDVSSMPIVVHAFYALGVYALPVLLVLMTWHGALGDRFGVAVSNSVWGGAKHLLSIYFLVIPACSLITLLVLSSSGIAISPTSQSFGQVALRAMMNDRITLALLGSILIAGLASLWFGLLIYVLGPILFYLRPWQQERG